MIRFATKLSQPRAIRAPVGRSKAPATFTYSAASYAPITVQPTARFFSQQPLQGEVVKSLENVDAAGNKAVFRKPEHPDDVRKSIALMVKQEAENLKGSFQPTVQMEYADRWLHNSEFEILEKEDTDEVELSRTVDKYRVTIRFSKSMTESTPNEDEEDNEEDDDLEADEESEDYLDQEERKMRASSLTNDQSKTFSHPIDIEVEMLPDDIDGEPIGTWCLHSSCHTDNRLYVEAMTCFDGGRKKEDIFPSSITFDTLSEATQDRIYDLLDELEVSDDIAFFIKQYVIKNVLQDQAKSLHNLQRLLSRKPIKRIEH